MHLIRLTLVFLLCSFATPLTARPSRDISVKGAAFTESCSGGTQVVHDTTPACNCTGAPGTVQVCHSEEVTLTIGGSNIGSFSTGQSHETCFSQTKNHGECLYIRYVFDCCYSWWSGWSCSIDEVQFKSSTSTCEI